MPITVRVDPNLVGGTITSPPSVVKVGIPFPIATVVNNAYSFKNWTTSGGGTLVIDSPALPSTNATLTKVTGTAPLIIQANFYTRPTVIVSPGFGASGQFLNQPILLQFTNKMVSSTLNLTSVTVNEKPMAPGFPWVDVTSTLFQGVSPTDSGRTDFNLVYKSGAQLTPYSYYQVTIAKTVQDDNGNAMAADAIYSFSTGGSANTSPPVVTATAIARTSTPSTTTTSVYTNSSQVYLSVTSTDLVAVVGLQITESNGSTSVVKSIANPGSGYFAYALDPSLGQGDHTVTVKALNSLGLYSTVNSSSTVHATFDTTAPTAALGAFTSNASNSAWAKNGNTLTLAFTASDTNLGTVAATINGTTATVSNTGGSNYTASAVLSGNALTYSVAVSDLAGNSTTLSTGASVGFTIDNTAPTVTSPIFTSNNATNTAFARNGDTLTLTFSAADTNLSGVTVSINSVAEAVTNTGGSNYMASQVLSGSAVTYSIQATDQAGNITTVTTGASIGFAIDNTAPSVGSLAMVSNNANTAFAKSGDTVTLSFTASDTNLQTVAATLNGAPATVTNTSGSNYTATAAVGASDVGSVPYSITVTDKAGNSTAVNTGVALPVTADNTAPALTLGTMTSNNSTNTAYAKSGNTITLNFTASDTNLNLPTATINGQSATVTNTSGSNYTATIALSGGSGALSYQVTATDKAGNSTSNTTGATQSFTVDNTAPAVALGTVTSNNSTNTGFAKAGDTITLNFTVTDTNPGVVTASINSQSATVANTGINYTATITLVGGSGTLSTSVTALDLAGNTSGAVTAGATQSFVVDNTAPSVTVGTMTTSKGTNPTYYAKSGDVVTLNFTASDTNMGTPTATINGNTATIANPSGSNYTATWTVGASDNGTVTYSIIVADLAGNSTTKTTGSSTTVTADNTAPSLTLGTMTSNNGTNNAYAKTGNTVVLNFTASDSNLNAPTATINGQSATIANPSGSNYTATIALSGGSGALSYQVTATDKAGNSTSNTTGATQSFTADNTAPAVALGTVTSNNSTNTGYAKAGDTITLNFTVTDTNPGVVTASINSQSATVTNTSGINYTATITLVGGSGTLSTSVTALDVAGNTSGAVTAGATQSFVVDNTAPSVTVGTMTTTKGTNPTYYAKSGDVVTLNFTASDTNMGTPTATINGNTATIANPSGNNYTATWTVGASDNGTVTYSIIVADLAGNSTTKTTGSSTTVTADNTAPTVTMGAMTSNNANNLYAKSGNVVTLNWTASDTNLNTVAANINGAGATVTNSYKATYTVGASDAGLVPYTITVTDLAGNQTVRTTGATSTVFMDNTPPTVTVTFTVNGTTVGTSTPDFISTDTIAVSASVTDSSLNASGATIQIDNHSVTESTVDGGATWTASRLFGSDNVQSYSVVIIDMAGNQTTRTGTLTSGTFVTTNLLWRSALGRQTFSALAQTEAVTTSAFDPWALLGRLAAPAAVPDVSVPTATPVAYVAEQRSAAPVARAARVTPAPKVNASEAPPLTPAGSAAPLTAPPPAPVATSAPTEVSAPAPAAPAPAAAPPLAPVAAAPGPAAPVAPAAPRPTPQDKGSPRIDLFWEEARIRRGANDAEDEKE